MKERTAHDYQRLQGCRQFRQYVVTRVAAEKGEAGCVFCNPDPSKVIKEGEFCRLLWCNPPHNHTKHHLLIVSIRHLVEPGDISEEEWTAVLGWWIWAIQEFKIPGGGLGIRFGHPRFNAGSIEHLHWNIWDPDGTGRVQMTLAKEPEEVAASVARAERFATVYDRLGPSGTLGSHLSA